MPNSGRCRFGAKCSYSHDTAIPTGSASPRVREDTAAEALCRKWKYMIPRSDANNRRFEAPVNTKAFFEIGWKIMENDDPGTRQEVISKLGSEQGLKIINLATEDLAGVRTAEASISIFKERILPFFRIISHPDVLYSLVLENPIDTIYTFIFGPSGKRGLTVFEFAASALCTMMVSQLSSDEEVAAIALSSVLAVLDRVIELNQSAQVIEGFTGIIETISACSPEDSMTLDSQQSLARIKRRLHIGSSLPYASTQPALASAPAATFELTQDLPGKLPPRALDTIMTMRASPRYKFYRLHHLPGLAGLLDRQFRLLREDTVGQLRDAVREEVARLGSPTHNVPMHQNQQGIRKLVYHNVRFDRMCVDRRRGLQVVAEFDQPSQIKNKSSKQREDWWKGSKLLQVDSLVCFVSSTEKIVFFSVCDSAPRGKDSELPKRDDLPSLFRHAKYASVLLSFAEYKHEHAIWIGTHIGSHTRTRQSLVEFPGVLLPSFQPTLEALQKMSKTLDLPFAEIIAQNSQTTDATIQPPAYAARPGFAFKLDVLTAGRPLNLSPGKGFDFKKFEERSTLDTAQRRAVIQALSTGLALIQGPPGTGKSYTGVAILKALIHNRKAAKLGPIICVCYTNHALDGLLEHLVNEGMKQVIRLGSRSKSTLLANCTLQNVRESVEPTKTEKHDRWQNNKDIGEIVEEIQSIVVALSSPKSWTNIKAHLSRNHQQHHQELFGQGVDAEGFQEVRGKKFRVVESWVRNAPKKLTSNRPVPHLEGLSLKEMSASERAALYNHWMKRRSAELTSDLTHALDSYHSSKSALDKCHSELDLRCLRQAHIIGVTTSGLARNIELLQRVHAKVMLCEEAGEVLEAHTLTAFLPGIEHAILIGDHEQLRPQINNYELQHDNRRGQKYSLDISLFERLVKPQPGTFSVPLSTLKTQRRMHPSMSELIRTTLYPDLQDHPSVKEYPEVVGMRNRLYWLDHQKKEDPQPSQAVSLSKTNTFEVEVVAALATHLVKQGTYSSEDIAIITPYLGQLQKIKKRLASSFEIVVSDRDQEDLEAKGLQDDSETSAGPDLVQKTTMLNALRIATVDNFQGEEAKVVIISLVRSNDERKCGFLKTSNRINVLLSRAQHGMYIIGNSDTARPVPMWAEVLSILDNSHGIGPTLELCCPRHKETPIKVSEPDDFVRLAPEDYYVAIHVLISAIRQPCTMQFAASNVVRELRKVASMSAQSFAEINAT
ncbi:NFX1-type zinc finger-containing protein [Lachnellula subtilissima]|uniref:NFX1-type zinc finger-containing protein n=1 Tax=Lachnellula subtilissima TaxID=602034 RepID=A0A8H8UCX8_9HELO|nr:NFX1-type zinc finger-containing protein [Lachnellula subtilissima]